MNYLNSLDKAEKEKIKKSRATLVGCGGTGGYVAELLIRLGVGEIVAVDGDCFKESNLNRQLLCTADTLGKNKAEAAKARAAVINPEVSVISVSEFLTAENAERILSGCDVVIDALDSVEAREVLHKACAKLGIPMVFGAIGPWRIQYGVIPPESDFFSGLSCPECHGEDVLSFVPALCASHEVCEAVKLLTGGKTEMSGKICDIDLMTNEQTTIEVIGKLR